MTGLLACLIGLWVPVPPPGEEPAKAPGEAAPAGHVHDYGGVGFPIVAYTPETSGLVALVGLGFFPGGGARPSSIRLTSLYTLNNQAAIVLDPIEGAATPQEFGKAFVGGEIAGKASLFAGVLLEFFHHLREALLGANRRSRHHAIAVSFYETDHGVALG